MWQLVAAQHGVVARKQLRALGFSDAWIDARIASEWLHELHQAAYAVGRPIVGREGRWMAAALAAGDGAALSHASAAALYELIDIEDDRVDVSVGSGRQPRHPGLRVHRRSPLPPVSHVQGIPVLEPLSTLLDIASLIDDDQLERAVNEGDKRGLLRADDALLQLAQCRGRKNIRRLSSILTRHTATDSDLERRFLRIARARAWGARRRRRSFVATDSISTGRSCAWWSRRTV